MYIKRRQLKKDIGIALLDTDAQVSLVREEALKDKNICQESEKSVQGITGETLVTKGEKMLEVNENKAFPFTIVERLPRKFDCILGQDWLKENNYLLATQQMLEPFSEKNCQFQTRERGVRLVENQVIQTGVYCAASLSKCENNTFSCLLVNSTPKLQII